MEFVTKSPNLMAFAPPAAMATATAAVCYAIYLTLTPKPIGDIPHNRLKFLVGDIPAILDCESKNNTLL